MGLDQYITLKETGRRGKLAACGEPHYFRKFNALHGWLARNVGEIENQEDLIVPRKAWKRLLDLAEELLPYRSKLVTKMVEDHYSHGKPYKDTVIDDPAIIAELKEKLPLTEGFFFGEYYYYNSWYFEDLENLRNLIRDVILSPDNEAYDDRVHVYTYRAWW